MIASLAESTLKQYSGSTSKWIKYCEKTNVEWFQPAVEEIMEYLTEKCYEGDSYGTLNSHRSAISLITQQEISKNESLRRFFRGVFRLRPPRPKYNELWNVDPVIAYLGSLNPLSELNLEKLSYKLVTSLALATGHRVQTFSLINIENILFNAEGARIKIPKFIKTSRPGSHQPLLILPFFDKRKDICAARTLREYVKRTEPIRKNTNRLTVTIKKPHKAASPQTISRWIKKTLGQSGIDTEIFTAHSTRHVSTSTAFKRGLDLSVIRDTAGWSKTSETFAVFYNKPLTKDRANFASVVLE